MGLWIKEVADVTNVSPNGPSTGNCMSMGAQAVHIACYTQLS